MSDGRGKTKAEVEAGNRLVCVDDNRGGANGMGSAGVGGVGSDPLTLATKTTHVLATDLVLPFRMSIHEFARLSGLRMIHVCEECTAARRSNGRDRTVWHPTPQYPHAFVLDLLHEPLH